MLVGRLNFLELPSPNSGVPTSLARDVRSNVNGGGNSNGDCFEIRAGTDKWLANRLL